MMGRIRIILMVKMRMLAALLMDRRGKYLGRNLSMVFLLGVLVWVSYLFFHDLLFSYVVAIEDIGFLLIDRLVTIGFLIFFFLLIVSSFIFSFASLFKSRETEYLFSTPVSSVELFTGKFFDIIVFSSWAILIMALPILYSYAKVRDYGLVEYALAGIVVLVPFVLIAVSFGTILAIVAKFASRFIGMKLLLTCAVVIIGSFVYAVIEFARPTELRIQFTEDFRALNLFINNFYLNANPFTPNVWLIQCLRALDLKDWRSLMVHASALLTTAGLSVSVLYTVVERWYFTVWLMSAEQAGAAAYGLKAAGAAGTGMFSQPPRSRERALFNKDVLLFVREQGQWTQLVLICVILALYFINLGYIPKDIDIEQWRTILFVMNFGFCGFVLATLAVRFVYPSISLEGDAFWVLGSSPLSTGSLFREKFITAFVAFFIIAETVGVISSVLLNIEDLYRLLTFGGIFLMSISLSCLAVGFGAAFPDFSERNPSRIVSSPGGILTVGVSLFYIGIMVALFALPAYKYTIFLIAGGEFPIKELIVAVAGVTALNAVTVIAPLWLGARSFVRREF